MIALPPSSSTPPQSPRPPGSWKDKSPQRERALADRRGETLFIDARALGVLIHRALRVLTDEDLGRIAGTYHAWRRTRNSTHPGLPYEDVPGFCRASRLQEIREQDHVLTPGRYVGRSDDREASVDEQINQRISHLQPENSSLCSTMPATWNAPSAIT